MAETTKRYRANPNCQFECYDIKEDDTYQFGCEFEFYIDTDKFGYAETIEKLKDEIYSFSNVDILVDTTFLPKNKDKNQCIQIKPDQSLKDHGIEVSIPITSLNGVKHYIEKILPLIDKYGFTNKETGLHFHISTIKKDGVNFNFYVYMLMCHDKGLLSSWKPRIGYSQNVMDILLNNSKSDSRKIKTKKGTIWNLERLDSNHIEIKTIGGDDYHKQIDKILSEFDLYADCFNSVLNNTNTQYRTKLIGEHRKIVEEKDKETVARYQSAISQAGLDL